MQLPGFRDPVAGFCTMDLTVSVEEDADAARYLDVSFALTHGPDDLLAAS